MMNRKRHIINILVFALTIASITGCSQYKAYSVKENPSRNVNNGVLYALPKTLVRVAVTVEHRDITNAPYYNYAAEYLGLAETELDTTFRVVAMSVEPVCVADPNAYYYVQMNRGAISVDSRHLLLGVGCKAPMSKHNKQQDNVINDTPAKPQVQYNLYDRTDTFYTRYDQPGHPSLVLTKKDVRNERQRAVAAAERLEEIQGKQQQLINGEYEGSYSVEAVQYLAAQLQRQADEVIASFCGTTTRETCYLYVDPPTGKQEGREDTIAWLLPHGGLWTGDAEEAILQHGTPIVCQVVSEKTMHNATRFVRHQTAKKKTSNNSRERQSHRLRYRVPEQAMVRVWMPGQSLQIGKQIPVLQMGAEMELPKRRVEALFDANTMELKYLKR